MFGRARQGQPVRPLQRDLRPTESDRVAGRLPQLRLELGKRRGGQTLRRIRSRIHTNFLLQKPQRTVYTEQRLDRTAPTHFNTESAEICDL